MDRIKRVSCFFKWAFQILFFALPVLLIVSWIYAPNEWVALMGFVQLDAIPKNYSHHILHTLSAGEKTLGCLVSLIPLSVDMFVLYMLVKLFTLYENGEIFSLQHVKYIRQIGYALLVGQLIQPFYQFAMGVVLTLNNPPHQGFASVTIDQNNIGILLTALLVILISWIVAEACKLHDDQLLTI